MGITETQKKRIDYEIDRHMIMFNVVIAARDVVEHNDADTIQRLQDALADYDEFKRNEGDTNG